MTTCKKCGAAYAQLSCPRCAIEKSRDFLRLYQLGPLLLVADGKDQFTAHSKPSGLHLAQFGRKSYKVKDTPWPAFCGAPANAGPQKRRRLDYRGKDWQTVCEKCRAIVEELLTEAREKEAIRAG